MPIEFTPPSSEPTGADMQMTPSYAERDDAYANVILVLSPRWRLIICKDGRQYVLQRRSSNSPNVGVWIGKSHNMTKAGLILSCSRLDLLQDIDIIERLLSLPARPNLEAQNG